MFRTAIVLPVLLIAQLAGEPVRAQDTHAGAAATDTSAPWPRTIAGDGYDILVYQPQVDRWEGDRLEARAAVSVDKEATPGPALGVIWLSARTRVDRENGQVALDSIQIDRASFPSDADKTDEYLAAIRAQVPAGVRTVALERLKASLAVADAEKKTEAHAGIRNDAPRIIYSSTPALLVLVDGEPVLRGVPGTKLLRAINTRALLLLDPGDGAYYLRVLDRWMRAGAVEGPWTVATNPPQALNAALKNAGEQTNLLAAPGPEIADAVKQGVMPAIYVSLSPAELLQSTGQTEFAPIPDTGLLYVSNMSSHVLIDTAAQDYYALISGRWFRTKSLSQGPWEFVAGDKLPADFAKIPENHPKGEVLASVSGTPQAQESMIDNRIPQTAAVDRKKATTKVSYDGAPELRPVEGTSLHYAVNSPTPVIRASNGRYYAVDNGVWFTSASLSGPWAAADEVPAEIYSIPVSSPLHNVTYVRVYDSTPDYIYVGYTPGYFGTVLAPDGVVYYGTGYYYPGWAGDYWYPWLPTYGFGAGFVWGAATGFAIAAISDAVWHGGPWRDRDIHINNNFNFDHNDIYNRWERDAVRARIDDRDRLGPDVRDRIADRGVKFGDRDGKLGPKEGRAIADRIDRDGKPDPAKRDALRDKGKTLGDKGNLGGDKGKAIADRAKGAGDKTKAAAGKAKAHQPAHKDLYAGKDGHVYKRGAGGWEKHEGKQFAHAPNVDHGQLNRAQAARHHGDAIHNIRHGGRQASLGGHAGGGRAMHMGGGGPRGGGFRGGGRRR